VKLGLMGVDGVGKGIGLDLGRDFCIGNLGGEKDPWVCTTNSSASGVYPPSWDSRICTERNRTLFPTLSLCIFERQNKCTVKVKVKVVCEA
jgi:hypothetical protein